MVVPVPFCDSMNNFPPESIVRSFIPARPTPLSVTPPDMAWSTSNPTPLSLIVNSILEPILFRESFTRSAWLCFMMLLRASCERRNITILRISGTSSSLTATSFSTIMSELMVSNSWHSHDTVAMTPKLSRMAGLKFFEILRTSSY